jgi:hypothetical protein
MKKLIAALIFVPAVAAAQGTPADYARAKDLRARYEALALNVPGTAAWRTIPASSGIGGP